MNWYKKAQINKESDWKDGVKSFLGLSVVFIASLLLISPEKVEFEIENNPQKLKEKIQVKQIEKSQVQQIEEPPVSEIITPTQGINIDLDKIWEIESSRGKNLWNRRSRARGHFQFREPTWDESVGKMGKAGVKGWDWWNGSMNKEISEQVANFYYNTIIPQMLNYFKIPDTIETRIGTYSWGIGHVNKAWEKYNNKWLDYAPTETQNYVDKYR